MRRLQTQPQAVSSSVLRVAPILGHIIAELALGTSKSSKSSTRTGLLGHTDARNITSQAAALREARVITTLSAGLAVDGVNTLPPTRSVLVLELARSLAPVEVGAVLGVGNTALVVRAGSDFETAWLLGRCEGREAEGGHGDDVFGQHGEERRVLA